MDSPRIYPVSGGSEAVETALKLARAYHLARGEEDRSVIIARIDGLDPADRKAIQAASILGQRFTTAALRHVLGDGAGHAERSGISLGVGHEEQGLLWPHGFDRRPQLRDPSEQL